MAEKQQPDYVTNAAWLRLAGRVDHVDEIADQFERPAGAQDFWSARVERAHREGGWLGADRLHADRLNTQTQDRRAS